VCDVEQGSARWANVSGVAWLGKECQAARLRKELWGEVVVFSFSGSTISYENVFCIDEP
jgi:hypothetical protein